MLQAHWPAAAAIFACTYAILSIQGIPKLHIDRPSGALLGAVGMVVFGVLPLEEAYRAVDLDTLLFLLGMMILIAHLELSGFFELVEKWIVAPAQNSRALLALVIGSSGILSAFFMNDTICLLYAPVILRMTRRMQLNPTPYLIGLATAANIGSVATILGNPQNALIGIHSRMPFLEFSWRLWPVAALGLIVDFAVIAYRYRHEIDARPMRLPLASEPVTIQPWLLAVSMTASCVMFVLLCLNFRPPIVTMALASIVIIAASRRPLRALQQVDWTLLFLFAGLFVVMHGVEVSGLTALVFEHTRGFLDGNTWIAAAGFSGVVAAISNVASNVPAVMLYVPLIQVHSGRHDLWLLLAMAATLAGNLTLIGSVANLIVLEAAKDEVRISFMEYFRVGAPITVVTILIGIAVIRWF